MLSVERRLFEMGPSAATTPTIHHSIQAFGNHTADFSSGEISFDSVVDDVDKRSFVSSRKKMSSCKSLSLTSVLVRRAKMTNNQSRDVPRTIHCVSDTVPASLCRDMNGTLDDSDFYHYSTIQVLEEFFNGIEDQVDVGSELRNYGSSATLGYEPHRDIKCSFL